MNSPSGSTGGKPTEAPRADGVSESAAYWDAFYKKYRIEEESTFCAFVKSFVGGDVHVFDIGCGSGRDSFSFARDGYPVTGIDRSGQAIEANRKLAMERGFPETVRFGRVDIGDRATVASLVTELSREAQAREKRLLVYLRFVLHSLDEETQARLLDTLDSTMGEGDILAAEFRVPEDESRSKVFPGHYRRYVDSDLLLEELEHKYRFRRLYYIKDTGLSVFNDEDPYLARIIAVKR